MRRPTVLLPLAVVLAVSSAVTADAGPAWAAATAVAPATRAITVTAPSTVRSGDVVTMSGRATPVRPGFTVSLWELRGKGWEPVAETTQSPTGTFVLRARADSVGRHSYRAVTTALSRPRYDPRTKGPVRVVTTLPSRPGAAVTYLGLTDPVGGVVDAFGDYYVPGRSGSATTGPSTVGGTATLGRRAYPRSLRTTSRSITWSVGGDATTFSATLGLVAVRRGSTLFTGTRVVEVVVDGITRVRRTMEAGEVLPVVIDLRGHRYVTVSAESRGWLPQPVAADLVVGTPMVSDTVRPERGVVVGQPLTNLYAEMDDAPAAAPAEGSGPQPLVDGWVEPATVGSSSLRGRRFRHALFGGSLVAVPMVDDPPPGVVAQMRYPLNGRWTRLTGRPAYWPAGLSRTGLSGRVELYGDGRLLASLAAAVADVPALRSVDVTGVQTLDVRFVSDHSVGRDLLALADPRLT
ncbi:MAG TPA: hypothetical protein VF661_09310 [Actinomycetales bacterium]|jgi:hypothetical protein